MTMTEEHSKRLLYPETPVLAAAKLKKPKLKKPKLHNQAVCLVCEEDLGNGSMTLHRTRRQTHSLCGDCVDGYIIPILENMTDILRQNLKKDIHFFKCPGNTKGELRNMCNHEINMLHLYNAYYTETINRPQECPSGLACRKVMIRSDQLLNVPQTKICKLAHHNECPQQYKIRTGIQLHQPPILDIGSQVGTMMFRINYVITNTNTSICPNRQCGNVIHSENIYEAALNCTSCKTTWCKNCNVSPFHKNMSCHAYEAKESKTEDGQYKWKLYRSGHLKDCPSCRSPAMKSEGCNKMSCIMCGVKWCWVCRAANIDYDHFNSQSANPCSGKLWDRDQEQVEQPVPPVDVVEPNVHGAAHGAVGDQPNILDFAQDEGGDFPRLDAGFVGVQPDQEAFLHQQNIDVRLDAAVEIADLLIQQNNLGLDVAAELAGELVAVVDQHLQEIVQDEIVQDDDGPGGWPHQARPHRND